jgi:hypothetical protein
MAPPSVISVDDDVEVSAQNENKVINEVRCNLQGMFVTN